LRLSGYTQWFYIVDTLKVGQQYKRDAFLRFNSNNGYANAPRTLSIPLFRIFVTTVDFESKAVSITVTSNLVQYNIQKVKDSTITGAKNPKPKIIRRLSIQT